MGLPDEKLPEVGTIWAHVSDPPRRVVEVSADRRVRWDRPGKRARWVKLDTWRKWVSSASRVDDWPKVADEEVSEPPTEVNPEWIDLGDRLRSLAGVMAPSDRGQRGAVRAEWLRVVSECLARGVTSRSIADATGLAYPTVTGIVVELRERYAEVTPGQLRLRQEQAYQDARRVYDEAMRRVEQFPDGTGEKGRKDDEPTDGRVVAPLLKVALDASKRMAAVVGADRQPETAGTQVTVNATSNTVTQTTMVNPVLVASQRFGLDPMALAALGDVAAEAMTDGKRAALEQEA